ncbi:hypothetical protein KC349_g5823 [Hortaea werneckii]|nr:hypothetical protein KC349_g5823 [Hortaea werneckii]
MLAGACAIGSEKLDYHLPDHPMQLRVKRVVEDLSEASNEDIRWGLDGCNLPAPALPLRCTSLMYAKFAAAADAMGSDSGQLPQRTQDLASIYNAMARYPEMVGGEGRFCTVLMEAFGGTLVGKLGADACYGVGVRSSDCTGTVGSNGALGISVKVEDGSIEILYAVVVEILAQLKIGTPEQRQRLAAFHYLERRNTMNIVTGNVSMAFKVRPV